MRSAFAPLALAALAAATPMPQASSSATADCSSSYDGEFMIQVVNVTSSAKRSVQKRQDKVLTMTLQDGVLKDDEGRTGYIASNNQFQFDAPPQANALETSGFSICSNGSLALDGTAIWYQCLSGDFYNLYDENDAAQCSPVYINAIGGGSSASASASGVASQIPDGQVTASPVPSAAVCQLADGQPQNDANCVSQIGDGQVQAPTGAPVTQISDGQVQASTAAPVTQISDGQVQAPTSTAAPVTQIGDGQIQAPSAGTGSPAAPTNGTAIASPTISPSASAEAYTGAATTFGYSGELFAIAAGLAAVAML
ncbi:hypothetical protein D0869_15693 [Hortaea werneckii]|uniref:Cell wall mannoprotein PIR1-like C-terminal domain-containing protein n=1 Tax=Hortaea werneckii TaxID=91943 RepID=A0A3M6XK87_HORWE|nr:hypothetical protein KC355_g7837 [Hortaea werneckii]KAI7173168.1 hypothetical protein KC324_g10562 [Hortaea werneckii]KAI7576456.1 hypothetical protein KC316_g10694 [Hortaea werneckii]RMX71381.1 hypothetical protein D0869_15693 [Hortaea werneckii]RMX91233.1 hypothetical protein D0868_14108 [Hortaea werneckii]